MKKILGLLTLVLITAILSATVTFFAVTNQYAERRSRDQDSYEKQIDNLEAKVARLEAASRQGTLSSGAALSPGSAATASSPNARPNTTTLQAQPAVLTTPGQLQSPPALPIASAPALLQTAAISAPVTGVPVTMLRYEAGTTGNKCQIDGTSSIHDWNMVTPIVGGFFAMDSKVILDPAQATPAGVGEDGRLAAAAEVTIPVRSLKSYKTAMDEVYQEHMEAAKFRKIEYRLKALVLKKSHSPNTPFEFDSVGELVVHGVTNLVAMPVKIDRVDAATLKISGTTGIKMTDYKVNPPCPTFAGVKITTGDDITVTFQWIVIQDNRVAIVTP